ncbi:DNA primase [Nitrosospira sp. Nsp14]|uniref:CHC2 zinc finger domain-containing protein n=1 Tax=Nitrosospira sp. Nsp14 TaxID=1855333 RepID=UPI0008EC6296|nr:CHC2 zinc finger domain-containing protein [Nitrosospira sp. Nsp14]SFH38308.1 DNA primase [Nitrosospira sp. Nsp14]
MKLTIQTWEGNRNYFLFRRDQLAIPSEYHKGQDLKPAGKGEWKYARCPFQDDTRPSLRINVDTGGVRGMACGAHGSDVLAFHRQLPGLSFVEAAKQLGAWGIRP